MWRRDASSSAGRAVAAAALALAVAVSCDDAARERARAGIVAAPAEGAAAAPRSAGDGATSGPAAADPVADAEVAAPLVTLVPSDDPAVTAALEAGLRVAFDEARAAGGPALDVVVSTTTPRWGSAVEGAVTDASERNAVAIVAPPERRHAHLLAQFGTKMRIPVLSTSPAHSVLAAGSRYVAAVVPTRNGVGDETPEAPAFDAGATEAGAFAAAFRARHARTPGAWDAVGYDAGRAVVEAVRARGLHRRGLVDALEAGPPVRGAAWDLVFRPNGACARREREP